MNKIRSILIIVSAVAAIALASCRSHKAAIGTVESSATDVELFGMFAGEYSGYTDIYIPVNVTVKGPANLSISGRATMVRDKELHISLRVLGMEVASVYANTDSIFFVDKYHKMYFAESLKKLLADESVTIGNLQDLLLGRPFVAGGGALAPADLPKFSLSGKNDLVIVSRTPIYGSEYSYTVSRTEPAILRSFNVTLPSGKTIACLYGMPQTTQAGYVASDVSVDLPIGHTDAGIEFSWSPGDAKFDSGRVISFSRPGANYKRISLDSLLKTLKNM